MGLSCKHEEKTWVGNPFGTGEGVLLGRSSNMGWTIASNVIKYEEAVK
jgi:hypothetical protein